MKLGMRTRQSIFPPPNESWASGQFTTYLEIPYPVRFAKRESFENFIAELGRIHGSAIEIKIPVESRDGRAFELSEAMKTADEAFAFTARKLHSLYVCSSVASVFIDNRNVGNTTVTWMGLQDDLSAERCTAELVAILAKHATASPRWRRWPRVSVLTDVPGHEFRNRKWQAWVGVLSVFLGGAAGVVGSWIVTPH